MKHFFASNFINNQKAENYFNIFLNAEIKCPIKKTFIYKIKSNLFNFNVFFNKYFFIISEKHSEIQQQKKIIYLTSYSELLKKLFNFLKLQIQKFTRKIQTKHKNN